MSEASPYGSPIEPKKNAAAGEMGLFAVQLSDGSELWKIYLPGKVVGSPQIVGERVYLVIWDTPTNAPYSGLLYLLPGY